MKRITLIIGLLFIIAGTTSAQSNSTKELPAKATSSKKSTTTPAKAVSKKEKENTSDVPAISNRKIINWSNGQRATVTGNEASAIGGGYLSLKKSATVTNTKNSDNDSSEINSNIQKRDLDNTAEVPPISNRKIVKWPNGQRATITGNEAAPVGGTYSSLKNKTQKKKEKKVNNE